MSNRPARITQAEIERAIRAAKKAGVTEIELKIGNDATVRIPLAPDKPVAETEEIVL
jgi:2-iminoacetate synthase ThiH